MTGAKIIGAVAVLWVAALWITAPTEAQIQKCAEETGWTKDRCRVEMTR